MDGDKSINRLQERFIRWQDALRQTLSAHVTLIVAFASGGLGFVGSMLNSDHARFSGCTPWLALGAGMLFLLSLLLALFISCNRLQDVRATLEILKHRRKKSADEIIADLEVQTTALGNRTWTFVYCQLGIFAFAAVLFSVAVFFAFEHRLFPQPDATVQRPVK
jgi:hypothetical protein